MTPSLVIVRASEALGRFLARDEGCTWNHLSEDARRAFIREGENALMHLRELGYTLTEIEPPGSPTGFPCARCGEPAAYYDDCPACGLSMDAGECANDHVERCLDHGRMTG